MKFVVVFSVLIFGFWLWKQRRKDHHGSLPKQAPPKNDSAQAPLLMVTCQQCGLHLPQGDAVSGRKGSYCSQAHRSAQEG